MVSVVLCTWNGERHLPALLASLRAQRHLPDELLARDDDSDDDTRALLEEFGSEAPFPVRITVSERRLGPSRNFGRAIGDARGEVLFLADQDDVWHPEKISRLTDTLGANPSCAYAFSDALLVDAGGDPTGETFWEAAGLERDLPERFNRGVEDQLSCLLERNVTPGAALAFRGALRDWVLPIPGDWPHDWWIAVAAAGAGRPGQAVAQPLLRYRCHPEQATGLDRPERPAFPTARYRHHRRRLATQVERHERRLARLEGLRDRLEGHLGEEWPEALRRQLEEELAAEREHASHVRARERVRSAPLPRAVRCLWDELRRGRYRRHSGSLVSAAADLWDRVGGARDAGNA